MIQLTKKSASGNLNPQVSPVKRTGLGQFFGILWDNNLIILLALPGIALIFLLRYVPMFGIVVAFEDFRAGTGFLSPWVGLKNFQLLFGSPVLWRIVKNTLVLNVLFISVGTVAAVGMALMINELGKPLFKKLTQSIMYLPFFMSWTVVAMILYGFFDYDSGLINNLLSGLGIDVLSFYEKPEWWPAILTILHVWKSTGSGCILYLAVLVGIDTGLYEAAEMDGASRWQRMRFISIPLLLPTISLVTLLAIGRIFYGDFGMLYAIIGSNALLYPTTDVIDTYIIRALQTTTNFGMSTAVGLSQSVLGFIAVFGSNWIVKKWSKSRGEDYSLF
ncbi:MAG: sugar ABC transporter permease [Anaerolineales bacterium]|nr:MAG: sugar ABC transporter permease [Anaerolineales bacterium]